MLNARMLLRDETVKQDCLASAKRQSNGYWDIQYGIATSNYDSSLARTLLKISLYHNII